MNLAYVALALAPWLGLAVSVSSGLAAQERRAEGSAESVAPSQIAKLQAAFRRAKTSPARQAQLVQQAAQLGPEAVAAVQQTIEEMIRPALDRYRRDFYVKASVLAQQQLGKADTEEIARLRQFVLGLQHQPDFTKELIVAKGDPAMKRLEEIFSFNPVAVLGGSKDLQIDRRNLMVLGLPWQQCAMYLYRQLPDDGNKPKEPPSFDRYLQGEEQLAMQLSVPMDAKTRDTLAANAKIAKQLDPEETRTILALNLTRNLLGLPALAIDLKLSVAARDHSRDMQKLKFFAHESPVSGKKTPWDRAARFGTSASAENIAVGYQDGIAANLGWFHSPGHHKNMLGNHARVGVGRVGSHYTEMFGR